MPPARRVPADSQDSLGARPPPRPAAPRRAGATAAQYVPGLSDPPARLFP